MKKLIFILMACLGCVIEGCKGQQESVIFEANKLIENKKYESAYNLLNKFDSTNIQPDIVLLKERILLDYFVMSIMHKMFALKDIEPDEDILDYRGKEGHYNMVMMPIDSILQNLIVQYPDKCELYKGLAEYYLSAYNCYGGRWLIEKSELERFIIDNYKQTIERHCADYNTYFNLGVVCFEQNDYEGCIAYCKKAVELDSMAASAHYNLSCAYYFTKNPQLALQHATTAFELYQNDALKADVARLLGHLYLDTANYVMAKSYYEKADSLAPNNYYNLKALLEIYLLTKDNKVPQTTQKFYELAPDKPTIYNDLRELYDKNNRETELISFLKSQLSKYDDEKIIGSLYFYLATMFFDTNKKTAKTYFLKAKNTLKHVYEKDHNVFEIIDEQLKQCR